MSYDSEIEQATEEVLGEFCPHCWALSPFALVFPDGTVRCVYCRSTLY